MNRNGFCRNCLRRCQRIVCPSLKDSVAYLGGSALSRTVSSMIGAGSIGFRTERDQSARCPSTNRSWSGLTFLPSILRQQCVARLLTDSKAIILARYPPC